MFKRLFLVFLLCFFFGKVYSQRVYPSNKDFVLIGNQIWVLKSDSSLSIFNTDSNTRAFKIPLTDFKIACLRKDDKETVFASTGSGRLMRLNKTTFSWEDVKPANFKKGFQFAIDHFGGCFQLIDEGVLDTQSGKIYTPGKEFTQSEMRYRGGSFKGWDKEEEQELFVDRNNNLWFTVGYGEWGSDLFIFNTRLRVFIALDAYYATGGAFETDKNVYCLGGGFTKSEHTRYGVYYRLNFGNEQHSDYKMSGRIIYNTLNNAGHQELMKSHNFDHRDYIGLASFNKADGNIYFLSPFGLYKGDPENDLADISKWKKLEAFRFQQKDVKPRRHHYLSFLKDQKDSTDMQQDYDVNIPYYPEKIGFTNDGKLIFTSYHDGLGIFDGKKIIMLDKTVPAR